MRLSASSSKATYSSCCSRDQSLDTLWLPNYGAACIVPVQKCSKGLLNASCPTWKQVHLCTLLLMKSLLKSGSSSSIDPESYHQWCRSCRRGLSPIWCGTPFAKWCRLSQWSFGTFSEDSPNLFSKEPLMPEHLLSDVQNILRKQ